MIYLYWVGALIVFSPLVFVLPLLSRNRFYRTGTLFAGMNVGIITLSFFINLLRFGPGPSDEEQFIKYFTTSLPNFYIASFMVGSTIVLKFYLNASTRLGTAAATLGSIMSVYLLTTIVANVRGLISATLIEDFPFLDILSETIDHMLNVLTNINITFLTIFFVSGFIALNGTATVMRMSDETTPLKDEETEQRDPS